jgi:isocitrate dehydrogenase
MEEGDFYHGEKSMTLDRARNVKMEIITKSVKQSFSSQKLRFKMKSLTQCS